MFHTKEHIPEIHGKYASIILLLVLIFSMFPCESIADPSTRWGQPIEDSQKMHWMILANGCPRKQFAIARCISRTTPDPVFSHNIVGFGLVEMAISTNPKPTIYRNYGPRPFNYSVLLHVTLRECCRTADSQPVHGAERWQGIESDQIVILVHQVAVLILNPKSLDHHVLLDATASSPDPCLPWKKTEKISVNHWNAMCRAMCRFQLFHLFRKIWRRSEHYIL